MPYGTFRFGPYNATWNGSDVGLVEDIWRGQLKGHAKEIRAAARYGDSVIDGIYRGGNCFMIAQFKEWTVVTKDLSWPFAAQGRSGKHGRALSDIAKALVLTAISGTPAATNGPVTRTYSKAVYAPEHTHELKFGADEDNMLIVFRCLPTEVTAGDSELRWFTDT